MRARCSSLCLLLVLSATSMSAAQSTLNLNATVLADLLNSLKNLFPSGADAVFQQDFPVARPPPNSPNGFIMCDYSCMNNFASSVKTGTASKGVLDVDIIYKPLAGVTSDMIVWLFNNDRKNVIYIAADNTTRTIPMHLLFHPVDHLFHTASTNPVTVGTKLVWCELPLTGCKYNVNSATAPWVCPTNRTGFLRSDKPSSWAGLMHTKVEETVTAFNNSIMEFVVKSNVLFGGNGTRVVSTTRHTWNDSPNGLQLRTQMFLGLMARGSRTVYDTSFLAGPANKIIKNAYLDGATNIPSGNITAAGYMAVLHFLQEYGTLHRWLPALYSNRVQSS